MSGGLRIADLLAELDLKRAGEEIFALAARLLPIPRSLTGEGVRRSLRLLSEVVPLAIHEVPSGTPVLDWTVPREWNVRAAYLLDPAGRTVADFADSPLHLVGYSRPLDRRMTLEELRPHLHALPDRPDWVPYRTAYWADTWGFCLSQRTLDGLVPGEYRVVIDATLGEGSLTYGEAFLAGASADEVLISCHVCHPALANDNAAGMALVAHLAALLARVDRRHGFRFVFAPGTIGAIAWLARNRQGAGRIRHGLVAACLGDPGRMNYKRSRRGDAPVDRAAAHVLRASGDDFGIEDFVPFGYDERQYGSPGFDLPVGSLTRTPYERYPEYHTSADDLGFIRAEALADSLRKYLLVLQVLEGNRTYKNLSPYGEPQLGRRGLYGAIGGGGGRRPELAMLWVLNQSDGSRSLLDVAERSGLPFAAVEQAAAALLAAGLLEEVG